jgi:hypothetical protein
VLVSPIFAANEFNLRYWGRSITPLTASNWLLGKAIPTQDKLRVLADWLQVRPDELRFGQTGGAVMAAEASTDATLLSMADREMLSRYLGLDVNDRKTVREVVTALYLAASLKSKR